MPRGQIGAQRSERCPGSAKVERGSYERVPPPPQQRGPPMTEAGSSARWRAARWRGARLTRRAALLGLTAGHKRPSSGPLLVARYNGSGCFYVDSGGEHVYLRLLRDNPERASFNIHQGYETRSAKFRRKRDKRALKTHIHVIDGSGNARRRFRSGPLQKIYCVIE